MSLLDGLTRVALVHAHPDDETIATGALIAELRERGVDVFVLTASRGEQGEIVPGTFSPGQGQTLNEFRTGELAAALAVLDAHGPQFLGEPPARAAGRPPREYSDSGMQWVTQTMAGPADDAPEHALSLAPVDEVAGDIAAWLTDVRPELVLTYDGVGGYGHPDHVRSREATELACEQLGLPLAEFFSTHRPPEAGEAELEWLELPQHLELMQQALRRHATQLTVDGTDIVHVGGQREPITTTVGLRRAR